MATAVFETPLFPHQSGDKIVSATITALFKRTGKIKAIVQAEPIGKLLQAGVDKFDFIGNGMPVQQAEDSRYGIDYMSKPSSLILVQFLTDG